MKLAVVIVGILIAAAIAWDAAERHYDNCVQTARADVSGPTLSAAELLEQAEGKKLRRRIDGCSRVPW